MEQEKQGANMEQEKLRITLKQKKTIMRNMFRAKKISHSAVGKRVGLGNFERAG